MPSIVTVVLGLDTIFVEIKVLSVNGLETRHGFTISSEVVPRVISINELVGYWIPIVFVEIVDIVIVVKEVSFDLLTTIIEVVKVPSTV